MSAPAGPRRPSRRRISRRRIPDRVANRPPVSLVFWTTFSHATILTSDLSAGSASATISRPDTSDERRFGFGKNWAEFLPSIDDSRIAAAVASIQSMLGVEDL